jgi:hypothetical protein
MSAEYFDRMAHTGWVVAWALAFGLLVYYTWRRRQPVVGLGLAYLANLSLVHWLSALTYALPWQPFEDPVLVAEGFRITTLGLVAFVAGWWAIARRPVRAGAVVRPLVPQERSRMDALPGLYLKAGGVLWALYLFVGVSLPSIGAVVSTGQSLFVAGLCLHAWRAWLRGRRPWALGVLALGVLFPLGTTVSQGFMGYGIAVFLVIYGFVAAFYRPRWQLVLVGIAAFYGGLSLYHAYMSTRTELRAVVWGGAGYGARFAAVGAMLAELKPVDLRDVEFLRQVDARLNQNYLVGSAAEHLDRPEDYARGETLWMAAVALVPRIVWPAKPVEAGSMELVSAYTGHQYAEGTSVGMGHPFELYVNFGTWGVVAGLALLGMAVSWVDRRAALHLRSGRWDGFALGFVAGLGLLQVGGSFVELTATVAAGAALVVALNFVALGGWKRRPHVRVYPGPRADGWSSSTP